MRGRETLRPTAPGDEGRLKTLWKVCFGDEDTYIGHFFAKGTSRARVGAGNRR